MSSDETREAPPPTPDAMGRTVTVDSQDGQPYVLRTIRVDQNLRSILPEWRRCNAQFASDTVHFGDPEWLLQVFRSEQANLRAVLVERDGRLAGVAPFLLSTQPLECDLGGIRIGQIPLVRLRLLGGYPNVPDESSVYDGIFREFLRTAPDLDAVWIECLRSDSFLRRYLLSSQLIKRSFHLYRSRGPALRHVVKPVGSFAEYMQKFSASTRWHRLKEVKKLRAKGEVQLVRITSADAVDVFVQTAADISRKTYQYNLLGLGLRDLEGLKERLRLAAERGWLRSYLLTCGPTTCAFLVSYQYNHRFYYHEIGYDPAWRQYSVGKILILLTLDELFARDPPRTIDFGDGAGFKRELANDSYVEADYLLFRRRPYPLLAAALRRGGDLSASVTRWLLERLHAKARLKRLLRPPRQ